MIHFDTNFLVASLRAGSNEERKSDQWLEGGEVLDISAVAWSEFLCGPLNPEDEAVARETFPSPETFTPADAELAAELFNQTGRRSRSLADCMIAAVAIRCGAKLATINAPDFQPFVSHGLILAK